MTKLLSKKSFIAFLIVCAVIVLAGIVAVSVAGFNADATVGGGQQLIYEKVFSKDDFQKEAQTIRDYLENNGARVSSLQPRENISDRDNYDAIVVNFTSDKPIESATINGVQCRLLEVDNARSAKLLKRASIALAAAVVIIYLYVLLRYLKVKGVYASLTVLIMMLWDFLVAAALVALFGFVGLQVNTYIMSVAAFVILYSAFNNVMLLSTLRSNEKNLKLEGEELVSLSVKQTLKRLLISCAVIVVLSLAAVFVCGGNVAQTCLALIIAVAVNALSAIFAAPRLWMSLNK
jgi:membrane protein